jgi:hypothetical protein
MKPSAHAIGTDDRISTREELGQVIGLLIDLHQLPVEASLQILEDSDSRSDVETDGLWTDGDCEAGPAAQVEPLANFILGRQDRLN